MKITNDEPYLRHILDAIEAVRKFAALPVDDDAKEAAIERKLEIIGEAVKRLSPALRQSHAHVPWNKIAGLRDRLIHDYMGVDWNILQEVLNEHLPNLAQAVQKILADLSDGEKS